MDLNASKLLEMQGISKSFPGVRALDDARLDLFAGEVHALLGENGAGKSTLMKILAGAYRPDSGTIHIAGRLAQMSSPREAQRLGVAVIYQEFNLVPTLSARENVFLGQEKCLGPLLDISRERGNASDLFKRMNIAIDPETLCSELTVAQQQVVEIAKAISLNAKIVVMDEPTAALTNQEVEKLFAIIRDLQAAGVGVIYITHRLDEVFAIADRATVMRDGRYVDSLPIKNLTRHRLIEMMVGRKLESEFPKRDSMIGAERLTVSSLNRGRAVRDVSFSIRRGEILGLTGLVGAGRTEVARLIFGADRRDSGRIFLDGQELRITKPRDAIRRGICLLSEDRKAEGLILNMGVRENFGLPNLPQLSKMGFVQQRRERQAFASYTQSLRIRIPHDDEPAKNLSGGNQQKVVLAKWLQANSDVIIFDEPTRGIDVGTKYDIYLLMNQLAAAGKAILMISSELPEVLGMSDRILVMHEGQIAGEIFDVPNATQEQIMAIAVGEHMESSLKAKN